MYGHIHVILKDLVLSVAGPDAWQQILAEAGVEDEASVLDTIAQPDSTTFDLVGATCKVLKLPAEQALRVFGHHFVMFALRSGNGPFLKSQGATLHAFLEKINAIHTYLERDHPNARFPFIESSYDPYEDSLLLTYLSVREGLMPLVEGVVEEVGARLYGLTVSFKRVEVPQELKEAAASNRAAAWRVTWKPRPGGCKEDEPQPAAEPVKCLSFPSLHGVLVDFMKLVGSVKAMPSPCPCTRPGAASDVVEYVDSESEKSTKANSSRSMPLPSDSEGDEELVMKRSSTRKQLQVDMRGDASLEDVLLRSAKARKLAAAWSDVSLPECRRFWQDSEGQAEHYDLSDDASSVDVFVSHSWSQPENWKIVMGPDVSYADVKSTTLAVMAKDIALMRGDLAAWQSVTLWVDKACIPQDIPALKWSCIKLIEKFIKRSEHVCVLFSWSYMERLWCVFEWACVLTDKSLDRLWLQTEGFMNERTLPLYLESIRYFSIKRCQCFLESDREILVRKIEDTFVSHEAFEDLVKATAVALVARSMAFRAGRSKYLHKVFFAPWVQLADELGFRRLAEALGSCDAATWRESATWSKAGGVGTTQNGLPRLLGRDTAVIGVSATNYHGHINSWFNAQVAPLLHQIRQDAVHSSP